MSKNLLLVDDQVDIVIIIEREFRRRSDYKIHSAHDSEKAWNLLQSKPVDLVLCDIRLNKESGFDLMAKVRQRFPKIGIMMMSAYRSASNREQANSLGVEAFFEKPFLMEKLVEDVEGYFLKKSMQPEEKSIVVPIETEAQSINPSKSGDLPSSNHFKLEDLVQLFCLNGRNVCITLHKAGIFMGQICIQKRVLRHAEHLGQAGDEAVLALLQIPEAQFTITEAREESLLSVGSSWEHLMLLHAMKTDHRERDLENTDSVHEDNKIDQIADYWKNPDFRSSQRLG